jgi:hypothetical protein
MDPFSTSRIVAFIQKKLKMDNKEDGNYDKELTNLLERGENHVKSNHIRRFSREQEGTLTSYVDPSYGGLKIKDDPSRSKSYVVTVSIINFHYRD